MVNLTCNCLNVKMHLQGSTLSALDVSSLNLMSDQSSDQFFIGKIAVALLDLGGITQECLYLTKSRMLCDWTIYSCINCGIDTHAVHVKQSLNQVLVSLELQNDPAYAASLMRSEEFSPAFRVVLRRTYQEGHCLGSRNGRHLSGKVESVHNVLQQQLTRFLQKEENATEDRIRQFRVQQKLTLESLEERSKQDQQIILRLISDNEDARSQRSPSDLMLDANLTPPMTPIAADSQASDAVLQLSGPDEELKDKVQDIPQHMAYHRHLQRPMRLSQGSRIPARRTFAGLNVKRMAHSLDSDGIFELEGLDCDMPTVTNSDEEADDDAFMDDPIVSDLTTSMEIPTSPMSHPVPATNQLRLYATSHPVSVPNWARRGSTGSSNLRGQVVDSDDDILADGEDPENIAASIKALARSVHNQDGTEIFGDLPRPRLNTLH